MAALIDIGLETTLNGRYRLQERLSRSGEGATWLGRDLALDRTVEIFALPSSDARAADVLDAARRAALADDPRLARVLDVGKDEQAGVVYVVSERLEGTQLSVVIAQGPLPAETARAVVGEAATALDSASRRGLHHLALSPEHLVLRADGQVRLRGLAVEAAATGRDAAAPDTASRDDVTALMHLLRACLVGQTAAEAGELPGDTPFDLVQLCAGESGSLPEPLRTPADLAAALAPWRSLTAAAVGGTMLEPALPEAPAPPEVPLVLLDEPAQPEQQVVTLPGRTAQADGSAPLTPVWEPADPDEPLGRLGPQVPVTRPSKQQTLLVLAVVAGVVVVGLVLAIWGLSGLGTSASTLVDRANGQVSVGTQPSATVTLAPPATGSSPAVTASASPTASPSASASGPVPAIAGIRPIDPQGDGTENDAQAPRAIDGNLSTAWTSATYKSAQFGGLKQGLGLLIELDQSAPVSEVDVVVSGTGGTVELRKPASMTDVTGSTLLATAPIDGGKVVLTPSTPTTTGAVLLWFTKVPQTSSGAYRIEVSEVTVK